MKDSVDIRKVIKFCFFVLGLFILFLMMSYLEGHVEQYVMSIGDKFLPAWE